MWVSCTGDGTRRGAGASVPVSSGASTEAWSLRSSGHSETAAGEGDGGKRERERGGGVMDLWRDAKGVEDPLA